MGKQTSRKGGKRRRSSRSISILAIFPMAALLMYGMIDIGADHDSVQEAARSGNLFLTLLRGSFYAAGSIFLLKNFKRNINWLAARFELVIALVYVLISAAWSSYPERVAINWVHFLGGCIVAYAAARYFVRADSEQVRRYLAIVFGLASTASLFAVLFVPVTGLEYFEWEEVYRWRGLTSNANSLGMVGLLTVWANFSALWFSESPKWKILYGAFLAVALVCLWGTESRTSQFLSGMSIIGVPLLGFIMNSSDEGKKRKLILLAYLLIIVSIVILMLFGDFFSADKAAASIGRDSNLSGRTYIWQDGFRLIAMQPLTGWAYDGHLSAYDVINEIVGHYHNGYIDMTVNGGFVGLLIFLALVLKIARNMFRLLKVDYRTFTPFVVLIAVFFVYNMTEVTLGAFSNTFWVTMLFGYFFSELTIKRLRRKKKRSNRFVPMPEKMSKKALG